MCASVIIIVKLMTMFSLALKPFQPQPQKIPPNLDFPNTLNQLTTM